MGMVEDVAAYLETNGVGTRAVDLFVAHMPSTPSDVISLTQSGGFQPTDTMSGTSHENPVLYVNLRHASYPTGYTKITTIFTLLHRFHGALVGGGTRYLSILARSSPAALGVDENNRHRWSLTFDIRKELV